MKRINVDTTKIDMNEPGIRSELATDLRRMDRLPHYEAPKGADAYRVVVTPSDMIYSQGLHQFEFEIQYGRLKKGNFIPIGKPIYTVSERLPLIS